MLRRSVRLAAVALTVAAVAVACDEGGITLPDDPPSQEAIIVDRNVSSTIGTPNIFVKEDPESTSECGRIYRIYESTDIAIQDADGNITRGGFSDLQVGLTVRLWIDQLIPPDCPPELRATAIEILP
jgi:hypothetical protein